MATQLGLPASSRVYDYLLGGKDNFAADRAYAEQLRAVFRAAPVAARANWECLHRVVGHLAADRGIRQFLDVGCGLPQYPGVHTTAQKTIPDARIVYVDNDPMVAVHARARPVSSPQGRAVFRFGDLREPDRILHAAHENLDFDQPIGLLLFAVLHWLPDTRQARDAVREVMAGLPAGSFLALSHVTYDLVSDTVREAVGQFAAAHTPGLRARSQAEIAAFFDGLDLSEPGLVPTPCWDPLAETHRDGPADTADLIACAGIAIKR